MNRRNTKFIRIALLYLLGTAVIVGFLNISFKAIDRAIDNKEVMKCNSALKSGNETYLKSCSCYYRGEDISCIYGLKKGGN